MRTSSSWSSCSSSTTVCNGKRGSRSMIAGQVSEKKEVSVVVVVEGREEGGVVEGDDEG